MKATGKHFVLITMSRPLCEKALCEATATNVIQVTGDPGQRLEYVCRKHGLERVSQLKAFYESRRIPVEDAVRFTKR